MNKTFTEAELDHVIERAVEHQGAQRASVIPILGEINEAFGYIPIESLGKIRRLINAPEEGLFLADSHLYATASFYSMFSLKPLGKHVIRFCEINEAFGYIPIESLGKIRRLINAPEEGLFLADSHLYATASFYSMFSLKPLGKHIIRFCESAPCHVVGARKVLESIQDYLGIQVGETTKDNQFTLLTTSCIGICAVGPVFLVDDNLHGNVTPERVPGILQKYQGGEE